MTISERIFYQLDIQHMSQKEFSTKTGIATTTISDWRKKNTNPGSDKIMSICAALNISPEYLLSGISEDSTRGHNYSFTVLAKGSEEHTLIELFGNMNFYDRAHILEYANSLVRNRQNQSQVYSYYKGNYQKIAEFFDIEVYMDSNFTGTPNIGINYLDDNVQGNIEIDSGIINGNFSKYVLPVLMEWFYEYRPMLKDMWNNKQIKLLPAWE
ncbi:MAG: helix-turn-helix domain-containing protein [Lachnospira sp.]